MNTKYEQTGHGFGSERGYDKDPDERLQREVRDALDNDHNVDGSAIDVEVEDGEVILKGTVDDGNHKQMTEDAVAQLPDNAEIDNQLRVGNNRQRSNPTAKRGVSTPASKHRA